MKLTILEDGAYAYSGMGLDEFEITEMAAGNSKTLSSDIREHCEYLEMKLKENFRKDTKAETNAQIARLAKLGYDVSGLVNWVGKERHALAVAAEERRLAEEAANNPNNFSSSLTMLNREGRAESNKQARSREIDKGIYYPNASGYSTSVGDENASGGLWDKMKSGLDSIGNYLNENNMMPMPYNGGGGSVASPLRPTASNGGDAEVDKSSSGEGPLTQHEIDESYKQGIFYNQWRGRIDNLKDGNIAAQNIIMNAIGKPSDENRLIAQEKLGVLCNAFTAYTLSSWTQGFTGDMGDFLKKMWSPDGGSVKPSVAPNYNSLADDDQVVAAKGFKPYDYSSKSAVDSTVLQITNELKTYQRSVGALYINYERGGELKSHYTPIFYNEAKNDVYVIDSGKKSVTLEKLTLKQYLTSGYAINKSNKNREKIQAKMLIGYRRKK